MALKLSKWSNSKWFFIVHWIAEWYHNQLWTSVHCACPGPWVWASLMTNSFLNPSTTSTLSSWFYLDYLIGYFILLSNFSCELWNRKLKINKIYFKKLFMNNRINSVKYNSIAIFNPKTTHILILYISSHLFGVKLNCWLNMQKSNNASKSFSSYFS